MFLFYFILFYFILFYFILFYFILFYFISDLSEVMHRVHETFIALAAQLHEIHEAARVRNLPENMILKMIIIGAILQNCKYNNPLVSM